ncbi:MAG TPA: universal stress protein [Chitinophagaceae bacterium]|nr:universal stress protein [Chitinophagaceae bacterium]
MKKILLVFDGTHFSEGAFAFASALNERSPILLTGAFLPQVDYANLWSFGGATATGPIYVPLVESEDADQVSANIEHFADLCRKHGIEYRIHKDFFDFALPELKKESQFADLLVVGSELFYENLEGTGVNESMSEMLHDVKCPVIVVPEKGAFPTSNVLAYDGSESSVFAIKQFAYLLPEFTGNATLLVHIQPGGEPSLPEQANMEELVARHFPDLTIYSLDMNARKYFNTWLAERPGAILVSGAFGRSFLSRLFRQSFVKGVIREHKLPVFIAHA